MGLLDDVRRAVEGGRIERAKLGGVYVRRRGKSVVLVNVPFEALRNVSRVERIEIERIEEKRNVVLIWLRSLVAVSMEKRVESVTIVAPSGLALETRRIATYRVEKDLVSGEVLREELWSYDVVPADLGFRASGKRAALEELRRKASELGRKLLDMKLEKVLVHRGCNVPLQHVGTEYREGSRVELYRCPRCGKLLTVRWATVRVEGRGWFDVEVDREVRRFLDPEIDEVYRLEADDDEEFKRRYRELLGEYEELSEEMRRVEEEVEREEMPTALRIADALGVKVVGEDEKFVYFSDGTRYFKGDVETPPHFVPSDLFLAVKDAEAIWKYVMQHAKRARRRSETYEESAHRRRAAVRVR